MWKSLKKTHVSTSSCEAEFSAISDCISQLERLYQLLQDLKMSCNVSICVWWDNIVVQQLAGDQGVKTRSKHILIRYQNVRQAVNNGFVKSQHCTTDENVADVFMKCLYADKFGKLRQSLGVTPAA